MVASRGGRPCRSSSPTPSALRWQLPWPVSGACGGGGAIRPRCSSPTANAHEVLLTCPICGADRVRFEVAARLGFDTGEYRQPRADEHTTLAIYPASVLERARTLLGEGRAEVAAAAGVFGVSEEVIRGHLLAEPAHARGDERREFDELPTPHLRKRRTETKPR
jgi:hypothetical protein